MGTCCDDVGILGIETKSKAISGRLQDKFGVDWILERPNEDVGDRHLTNNMNSGGDKLRNELCARCHQLELVPQKLL
jgi:hypothetical protein